MSEPNKTLRQILEERKQAVKAIDAELDEQHVIHAMLAHFRLGTIVNVQAHPHPKAADTYYVVAVDLGRVEKVSCVQARREYSADELLGMPVLTFEYSKRRVYGVDFEVLLVGVRTDDPEKPLSLFTTSRPAVPGNPTY